MGKYEKFITLSRIEKSPNKCYNIKMNFFKKLGLGALFIFPLLAAVTSSTPSSSTHIVGDQSLTLPLEPSASLMEIGAHYQTERRFVSNVYEADNAFELLGLNWEEALPEGTSASLEIRFRDTKGKWTEWEPLHKDNDHPDGEEDLWTYVITDESEAFQYRVFLATQDTSVTPKLSKVSFDAVDGGKSSVASQFQKLIFKDKNEVQSRKDWGADEELLLSRHYNVEMSSENIDTFVETDPDLKIVDSVTADKNGNPYLWPQQYPKDVKKIIVHHTATSSNPKNPEESIRAIYYYHSVTRGWGDIGYNYIIAPDGTMYQGRAGEDGVVAGHASGHNTGTVGIALLGNFEEDQMPGEMMQALTALIYEKAELHGIDVDGSGKYRGKTLLNVLGHRDVDATACPGDHAYDYLADIRRIVAASLDNDEESSGSYAYEEVGDRELLVVDPGKKVGVSIKIKNTGSKTWDSSTYLVVNANSGADKVITLPKDSQKRTATMKETSVAPGKSATFTFTATATQVGGLVHFEAVPVFNGTSKSDQVMDLGFYVEVEKKKNTSSSSNSSSSSSSSQSVITGAYTDLTFDPGEKKYVWVQVKNTSTTTWHTTGSKPFTLAFTKPQGMETGTPFMSFKSIKPGSSSRVYFNLTAPTKEGEYDLTIRPRLGSSNLTTSAYTLTITVGAAEAVESEEYENPIRIKLTPDNAVGEPIISSASAFNVYAGDKLLDSFSANSRVRVKDDKGTYTVSSGSKKWTVTDPVRFIPQTGGIMKILTMEQKAAWDPSINDNQYRGTIEVRDMSGTPILINELPLEDYLIGMAEETNSTPTEKLKAMSILARSYAYFYITQADKFPGMPYDGEDDPNTFQKYLGYGYELRHPNVVKATQATEGMVVTYKGVVIKTPYFSNSDGVATKSAKDVWGWTNTPYLVSVPDTYCKSTSFAGHGVGLSGCGAKALAEKGWSFEKIIKYYYTGVELSTLDQ